MYRYNKLTLLIVLGITLLSSLTINAQERTYSPLSRFGYGEMDNVSTSGYEALGNTGIAFRSSYGVNTINPAANTALDSLSFYFNAGMSYYSQKINSYGTSAKNSNGLFDYIVFGFSMSNKSSIIAGFKPYSSVGYNFQQSTNYKDPDNTISTSSLTGKGSLTKLFLGYSYSVTPNLSLGANIGYLVGSLTNIAQASFNDANALLYGTKREFKARSMTYDFGAQYKLKLRGEENRFLIFGATFQPKQTLSGDTTLLRAGGTRFGDDDNLFNSSYYTNNITDNSGSFSNKLPTKLGLGISYNIKDKLKVGFDYHYEGWNNVIIKGSELNNTQRFSVGAEFIPKDRSATNYLDRIRYRAGGFFNNNYVKLAGNKINNYGISLGFGLPLRRSKSMINISMEYGQRKASESRIYNEKYEKVKISFSLHELWFAKRKLD